MRNTNRTRIEVASVVSSVVLAGLFGVLAPPAQAQNSELPSIRRLYAGSTNEILVEDPAVTAARDAALKQANELSARAWQLYYKGKLNEAAKLREEADQISPALAPDLSLLPKIYQKQERWNDMLHLYLAHDEKVAINNFSELLPYALASVKAGKVEDAVQVYYRALDAMPKKEGFTVPLTLRFYGNPSQIPRTRLEAAILTACGMNEYVSGDTKVGIAYLRRAVQLYPRLAVANFYLGALQHDSGDANEFAASGATLDAAAAQDNSPVMLAAVKRMKEQGY